MGGSSGGGNTTSYIKAAAPGTNAPIAPVRTAAGAQPDNIEQAQFTGGTKTTDAENIAAGQGSSRLIIPLADKLKASGDNTQSGGTTAAPKASTIVGG